MEKRSHTTHKTAKLLPIYSSVEKSVAVVKKNVVVSWKITAFLVCSVRGPKGWSNAAILLFQYTLSYQILCGLI